MDPAARTRHPKLGPAVAVLSGLPVRLRDDPRRSPGRGHRDEPDPKIRRDVYDTTLREHLEYQRRNRRRGRMSGQIRLRVRFRRAVTPWFDYLMVSPGEMKDLVQGTGWRVAGIFEADGPEYVAK